MLCLTRPDVIAGMHDAFFAVGVDVVETASFGSFSIVLDEYGIADQAHELNVAAARLAQEVADGWAPTAGPATWPGRSARAPSCRRSATSASPSCATPTRSRRGGCSRAASTCSLIETCMDLLQAKAAMVACRRAMKAAGRQVPLQVQVTIETTGRMLVGSEIGAGADVAAGA